MSRTLAGAGGLVVIGGGIFAGTQFIGQQAAVRPDFAAQTLRRGAGAVVRRDLRAAPAAVDLGGRTVQTWAYDGTLPGPQIQATAGDELRICLFNELPSPTTVYWHGIALATGMDGVPGTSATV